MRTSRIYERNKFSPHVDFVLIIGTLRSDYDNDNEYDFFNVYPVRMRDCVRLPGQLVLSSRSRRRLDANYEIFNKSRPPTTSSLQVQRRVKRLVFKGADTLKCSVQLVSQCFGDVVASCVVCLLNIPATEKCYNIILAKITEIFWFRADDDNNRVYDS